jgi:hypothetical protein
MWMLIFVHEGQKEVRTFNNVYREDFRFPRICSLVAGEAGFHDLGGVRIFKRDVSLYSCNQLSLSVHGIFIFPVRQDAPTINQLQVVLRLTAVLLIYFMAIIDI